MVSFAVAVAAFLAIYVALRERRARSAGAKGPVQWGWLAAGVGLAALAMILGIVL